MSTVDEVKERLDIVEVIQSYVPLKKAGRSYKGACPFHSEKTPSFVVFPHTGTWHCFGACGTGGDLFTFIMKRENVDFGEALQLMARRAGVELKPPRQISGRPCCERSTRLLRLTFTIFCSRATRPHAHAPTSNGAAWPARRLTASKWAMRSTSGTSCFVT
jgi:DNA primase catalytic core